MQEYHQRKDSKFTSFFQGFVAYRIDITKFTNEEEIFLIINITITHELFVCIVDLEKNDHTFNPFIHKTDYLSKISYRDLTQRPTS